MEKKTAVIAIPHERIVNKIFFIRGKKVMFDRDIAELYGVPTRRLNEQVHRNIQRFPLDFMFQLNKQEADMWNAEILRSQNAISNERRGGRRYAPYVFTEQGVAMLSSVLNSERAVQVNIQVIRTFTKLREMIATHKDLRLKIEEMEKKYDRKFKVVFDAIACLLKEDKASQKKQIGFRA
jgi:phage regulator Rha-like protein